MSSSSDSPSPASPSVEKRTAFAWPALLTHGFRPFFLGGALWAAMIIPLWVIAFSGTTSFPFALDAFDWHRHEMIFGWLSAVIAGFLLTAVPNWTGRLPVVGAPLGALAGLWLAGRLALTFGGPESGAGAALIAGAFPLVIAAMIWREVVAGGNRRNLPVCGLISLYALGDVLFLTGAVGWADTLELGTRLGLAAIIALIVLIGGRVTPSFTRNWLTKRPNAPLPAEFDMLDKVGMAVVIAALVAWLAVPGSAIVGAALMAGGVITAARLARWRGAQTFAEPLVTVLHLGYGLTALGLILLGVSVVVPGAVAGPHAVAVGGFGVMTLAIMTRATLGHSGRPLTAGRGAAAIYLSVTLAAVTRVAAGLFADAYTPLLHTSAMLWTIGFGLYVVVFGRMLLGRRVDQG